MQTLTFTRQVLLLLAVCGVFVPAPAAAQPYPPVEPIEVPASTLHNLARTMHLLAASRPDSAQHVKILVYGQSISAQDWWLSVRDYLQSAFPYARLEMVNKAIGGFSTPRLVQTVAQDVISFYPDLILFHDYGNEEDYERIIRLIRSRTTAEIAIQNDHIAPTQNQSFHNRHSFAWLPALCETYDLACIDVRSAWQSYLHIHKLTADALLRDQVHLNDQGNYLMAEIIKQHLVYDPEAPVDPRGMVMTYHDGADFRADGGRLLFPFTGNRVDLLWKDDAPAGAAVDIRIDGRPGSAFEECWTVTRPGENLLGRWPPPIGSPKTVDLGGATLEEEEWTLEATGIEGAVPVIHFNLSGSKTGFDGSGRSDSLFISESGRIIIQPEYWFLRQKEADFSGYPDLQPGDEVRWKAQLMCRDRAERGNEPVVTVAQDLPNGRHILELTSRDGSALPVAAIRVYRPPLRDAGAD